MRFPRAILGVVFDMDGLLIDSERVVRSAMRAVALEQGREMPDAVFLRMVGLSGRDSRRVSLDHFGADFDHAAFDLAVVERVEAELAGGGILKAGVVELLDLLDARRLPYAVATSSELRHVQSHLADILPRFAAVVALGDYARGKPNPDPFLEAARRLGAPASNCLALEDSHNGVRAAHAAGMMTVMVPDLLDPTQEMRGLCLAIAGTLHEVRALLEG